MHQLKRILSPPHFLVFARNNNQAIEIFSQQRNIAVATLDFNNMETRHSTIGTRSIFYELITPELPMSRINLSPRFKSQTAISQSACADETRLSLDRHMCPTDQNHFLSVDSRSGRGAVDRTGVRAKTPPNSLAPPYFCPTLCQWAEQSISWRHVLSSSFGVREERVYLTKLCGTFFVDGS